MLAPQGLAAQRRPRTVDGDWGGHGEAEERFDFFFSCLFDLPDEDFDNNRLRERLHEQPRDLPWVWDRER